MISFAAGTTTSPFAVKRLTRLCRGVEGTV